MKGPTLLASAVAASALVGGAMALASGCGSGRLAAFGGPDASLADEGGALPPPFDREGGTTPGCVGLQCQIHECATGSTTVSGAIYDPAGKNPLYDVVVYVPNTTPLPLTNGASCDSCGSLYTGDPIATALTNANGQFKIERAPDGRDIPLVIQIGKWRRQLTIPIVGACRENKLPDRQLTLPRNHTEGDIPSIAISTGGADTLECLLRRVGLDDSEYAGGAAGPGHIHIFKGADDPLTPAATTNPTAPSSPAALWDTTADLMPYDLVLLSCEGQETARMKPQALFDYAAAGGRVFASHYHYAWFNSGPFGAQNLATWATDAGVMPDPTSGVIVTTLADGKPFPKGQALHDWLSNSGGLGGLGVPSDEVKISAARHDTDVTAANTASQVWIKANNAQAPGATQYFSFNTPFGAPLDDAGAPESCGRVVFSDLHVGAASLDYHGMHSAPIVPNGCTDQDLSPQEKVLEFMLFDLSSCVVADGTPPAPPPPILK